MYTLPTYKTKFSTNNSNPSHKQAALIEQKKTYAEKRED